MLRKGCLSGSDLRRYLSRNTFPYWYNEIILHTWIDWLLLKWKSLTWVTSNKNLDIHFITSTTHACKDRKLISHPQSSLCGSIWKMWAVMALTDTPSKTIYQHDINARKEKSRKMMVHFSSRPREQKGERNSRGRGKESPWEICSEIFGMWLEIFGSLWVRSDILQNVQSKSQEKLLIVGIRFVGITFQ